MRRNLPIHNSNEMCENVLVIIAMFWPFEVKKMVLLQGVPKKGIKTKR